MPNEILVVDDHTLARVAVRIFLEQHGFEVCGEASGGLEAIEKVGELAPAIVLLDVNMPGMNGVQAAREIRRIAPSSKIVLFSFHGGRWVADAMRTYCDAFVSKSAVTTELVPTLTRLIDDGHVLPAA